MKCFGMQDRMSSDLFIKAFCIKKQFHYMVKRWHPDKACNFFGLSDDAANSAYKLLTASKPTSRNQMIWPMSLTNCMLPICMTHGAILNFKHAERETQINFPEALQKLKEQ